MPFDALQDSEPVATFTSKDEMTLTFKGKEHLNTDLLGQPADIDQSWTYSITFRESNNSCQGQDRAVC